MSCHAAGLEVGRKTTLEGRRNSYDEVIDSLSNAVPEDVSITLLADRGFGDQKRYEHLRVLGWDHIIRFREGILVTDAAGTTQAATDWLSKTGKAKMLKGARVTDDKTRGPCGRAHSRQAHERCVVPRHQPGGPGRRGRCHALRSPFHH
jgi:hypothetical protein